MLASAQKVASLTAITHVTISFRGWFNVWTDRHCPELKGGVVDGKPTDTCKKYFQRVLNNEDPAKFDEGTAKRVEDLTGQKGKDFFSRDQGLRFMMSVAAELALEQRWNLFGILEFAPFQGERALLTSWFTGTMPASDKGIYARMGLSYKF